jgi:hypothetical protein
MLMMGLRLVASMTVTERVVEFDTAELFPTGTNSPANNIENNFFISPPQTPD